MTNTSTRHSLSVHLYYNEPWEKLLTKAVKPYLDAISQSGIIQSYFFIRYWERGPHIRLRLFPSSADYDEMLRQNIQEHFDTYLDTWPSQRTEPNYPDEFPDHFRWLPNNSIQFVDYYPETDRYGGVQGVRLAEDQFRLSAQTVLQVLYERKGSWTYADAMGTAIQLHLSFVFAVGMKLEDCISFFQFFYQNWIPHSLRNVYQKSSPTELQQQYEDVLQHFALAFDQQRMDLLPVHRQLWETLNAAGEMTDTLQSWVSGNQEVRTQLQQLQRAQHWHLDTSNYIFKESLSADQRERWVFFSDLIHLTNNRLGILNRDEAFVAYLIASSLKSMATAP